MSPAVTGVILRAGPLKPVNLARLKKKQKERVRTGVLTAQTALITELQQAGCTLSCLDPIFVSCPTDLVAGLPADQLALISGLQHAQSYSLGRVHALAPVTAAGPSAQAHADEYKRDQARFQPVVDTLKEFLLHDYDSWDAWQVLTRDSYNHSLYVGNLAKVMFTAIAGFTTKPAWRKTAPKDTRIRFLVVDCSCKAIAVSYGTQPTTVGQAKLTQQAAFSEAKTAKIRQPVTGVLVAMGEVFLKGKNKSILTKMLMENVMLKLGKLARQVKRSGFRLFVIPENLEDIDIIIDTLKRMPGLVNILRCVRVPADLALGRTHMKLELTRSLNLIHAYSAGEGKKNSHEYMTGDVTSVTVLRVSGTAEALVDAAKVHKNLFRDIAVELTQEAGIDIIDRDNTGSVLPSKDADITIGVYLSHIFAFVHASKCYSGIGGQPTGTGRNQNTVVALLSGGQDSPVAAFSMMKRGCKVVLVHCQNVRILDESSVKDKVQQLAAQLSKYQMHTRLHIVPFAAVQEEIVAKVPATMRMLVYKRLMLRIAAQVGLQYKSKLLVVGDSMAQVASQTAANIGVIYGLTNKQSPIIAPLIGMNKLDIIAIGRSVIETHAISNLPYGDCCSYNLAKHPELSTNAATLSKYESFISERVVQQVVQQAYVCRWKGAGEFDVVQEMKVAEMPVVMGSAEADAMDPSCFLAPSLGMQEAVVREPSPYLNLKRLAVVDHKKMDTAPDDTTTATTTTTTTTTTTATDEGKLAVLTTTTTTTIAGEEKAEQKNTSTDRSIFVCNHIVSPVDKVVTATMLPLLVASFGNAHSPHDLGRRAARAVSQSRDEVAKAVGANTVQDIFFTSGVTESNNLIVQGLAKYHVTQLRWQQRNRIIVSPFSHRSVIAACEHLGQNGWDIQEVKTEPDTGKVDLAHLEALLSTHSTLLVTLPQTIVELGGVQPMRKTSEVVHKYGALLHNDATQALGKMAVLTEHCDFMTISAHTIHGPTGIGAVYISHTLAQGSGVLYEPKLCPLLYGGNHEKGVRPGTLNVPGMVGFAKACQISCERNVFNSHRQRMTILTDRLHTGLKHHLTLTGLRLRLPGNLTYRIPEAVNVSILQQQLETQGIHAGYIQKPHQPALLVLMLSKFITEPDVDVLIATITSTLTTAATATATVDEQ